MLIDSQRKYRAAFTLFAANASLQAAFLETWDAIFLHQLLMVSAAAPTDCSQNGQMFGGGAGATTYSLSSHPAKHVSFGRPERREA